MWINIVGGPVVKAEWKFTCVVSDIVSLRRSDVLVLYDFGLRVINLSEAMCGARLIPVRF